jgi:hypothetical protein
MFMALLITLCLASIPSVLSTAGAVDRGEELAGDHEKVQPGRQAPGIKEPERGRAGVDAERNRPTLKLPEVVIQGERQFRVTAQRRDLLLMDPMRDVRDMPADLQKLAMPGLAEEKGAPRAETVTAKNHLLIIESGMGSSRQSVGRLVSGYELKEVNMAFQADYAAGEYPVVYAVRPFDQGGGANLNVCLTSLPGVRLSAGLEGKAETHRQPEGRTAGWGDWMEQAEGRFELDADFYLNSKTRLKITGGLGDFMQHGSPYENSPVLKNRYFEIKANMETDIHGLTRENMNLLVEAAVAGQNASLNQVAENQQAQEVMKIILVSARFRPFSLIHIDFGVKISDLQGIELKNTSHLAGQVSLILPGGPILYTSWDGGLNWMPVPEWAFQHPRQSVGWLPGTEEILGEYRAGYRQRFGDDISADLSAYWKTAQDTPIWVDGDRDGLFSLINLPSTSEVGGEAGIEIRYSRAFSHTFTYVFREAQAGSLQIPNLPAHEITSDLRCEHAGWDINLIYHFLGERYGDPVEDSPGLAGAHLLEVKTDLEINSGLSIFVNFNNILGYTWEKWIGYPERGFSVMGGIRVKL